MNNHQSHRSTKYVNTVAKQLNGRVRNVQQDRPVGYVVYSGRSGVKAKGKVKGVKKGVKSALDALAMN
jgi:hypothetical protein